MGGAQVYYWAILYNTGAPRPGYPAGQFVRALNFRAGEDIKFHSPCQSEKMRGHFFHFFELSIFGTLLQIWKLLFQKWKIFSKNGK